MKVVLKSVLKVYGELLATMVGKGEKLKLSVVNLDILRKVCNIIISRSFMEEKLNTRFPDPVVKCIFWQADCINITFNLNLFSIWHKCPMLCLFIDVWFNILFLYSCSCISVCIFWSWHWSSCSYQCKLWWYWE